jgi:hypothetical protein
MSNLPPEPPPDYQLTDWSVVDQSEWEAAKWDLSWRLRAALEDAGHGPGFHSLDQFVPDAMKVLRPGEAVEQVGWADVTVDGRSWHSHGFLLLTGRRLMLLHNFYYGGSLLRGPHCLLWHVDRSLIVSATCSPHPYGNPRARQFGIDAGVPVQANLFGDYRSWARALGADL